MILQECPSDPQGTDYRMKLKSVLARSFDAKELEALDYSVRCRKPVQKQRQMRGRVVDVVTEDEGLSYLDHHQGNKSELVITFLFSFFLQTAVIVSILSRNQSSLQAAAYPVSLVNFVQVMESVCVTCRLCCKVGICAKSSREVGSIARVFLLAPGTVALIFRPL